MLPGAKVEQLSDGNETLICSSVCAEDGGGEEGRHLMLGPAGKIETAQDFFNELDFGK